MGRDAVVEEKLDGVHDSERRHAIACGSPSALERSSENRECVASDRERLSRKDWLSLVLLGLTVLGMQSDQNLLAPNLTAIAKEFGFGDLERDKRLGGDLSLAYFCVGAPVAVLTGSLADLYNRKRLLVLAILLGEIPCLCIYFVETYWQLFALRALAGISSGGVPPILYSLLGDIVPVSQRSIVASGVAISLGAGVAGGQLLAGFFGSERGWRVPFLIVSVPTIVLSLIVSFVIKEPPRAAKEEVFLHAGRHVDRNAVAPLEGTRETPAFAPVMPRDSALRGDGVTAASARGERVEGGENAATARVARQYKAARLPGDSEFTALSSVDEKQCKDPAQGDSDARRRKTPLSSSTSSSSGAGTGAPVHYAEKIDLRKTAGILVIPSNALIFAQSIPGCIPWGVMNAFFNDFAAQDKGLGVQDATQIILAFGAGSALGTVGGGWLAQWLYNRRKWQMPVLMGVSTIVATFPVLYIINTRITGDGYGTAVGAAFLAGLFSCVAAGNTRTVLLNVNAPETRGTAFAIYSLLVLLRRPPLAITTAPVMAADNLGKGLGPFIAASLIARLGTRVKAFNMAISFWIVSGTILICIAITLSRDEHRLQVALARIKPSIASYEEDERSKHRRHDVLRQQQPAESALTPSH